MERTNARLNCLNLVFAKVNQFQGHHLFTARFLYLNFTKLYKYSISWRVTISLHLIHRFFNDFSRPNLFTLNYPFPFFTSVPESAFLPLAIIKRLTAHRAPSSTIPHSPRHRPNSDFPFRARSCLYCPQAIYMFWFADFCLPAPGYAMTTLLHFRLPTWSRFVDFLLPKAVLFLHRRLFVAPGNEKTTF